MTSPAQTSTSQRVRRNIRSPQSTSRKRDRSDRQAPERRPVRNRTVSVQFLRPCASLVLLVVLQLLTNRDTVMAPGFESPAAGDVLIISDQQPGGGYTLAIAPDGPSQLLYASYDDALKVALQWATTSGVAVWRANGDARFDPVLSRES